MTNLYKMVSNGSKFKNCLKSLVLVASIAGASTNVNAQVSAYTFTRTAGTFNPLTGGTILGTATADTGASSLYNVSYPVVLPFPFVFNGNTFNNVQVTTNGYITFGGTTTDITTTPVSVATDNWKGVVSAWGRATQAAFYATNNVAGDVRWDVVGTAPNREMVIQWTNFRPIYSTTLTTIHAFSFQIRLKESTNEVVTTYNTGANLVGSAAITGTSQIGLRGSSSLDYNNRLNASTLAFGSSTAGTANTSTQYFSTSSTATSGMPAAGLTYTWTPPTCISPDLLSSTFTSNSATVNWSAPTPAPASYDIYYNTTGIAPTSTTTPSITGITGTSTTIGSLNPLTLYHIWIRSNCGSGNVGTWSPQNISKFTQCQQASLDTYAASNFCTGQSSILTANTSTPNAVINWYDSATSTIPIGTGNSYTTPALTASTDYWVATSQSYNANGGVLAPVTTSGNTGVGNYGLILNLDKAIVLNSVDVYPYTTTAANAGVGAGTVTIVLQNASGTVLQTTTATVNIANTAATAAVSAPSVVSLNYTIPAGTGYKLLVSAKSSNISGFVRESGDNTPDYPLLLSDVGTIGTTTASYYYYLYNLNFTSACVSPRQQVTATLDAACLGTSEISAKESLKVYPNPFTDYINITNVDKVKSAKVLDLTGRVVKTIGQVSSTINLSELQSGVYLLNFELKDGSVTSHKIMKK